MAAITQPKYGLWSRRYGSFTGKTQTEVTIVVHAPFKPKRTLAIKPERTLTHNPSR